MARINEIVIVYEVLNREYDNALLLQAELERRGFKVKLAYKEDVLWRKRKALFLIPNGYSSEDIDRYKYISNVNGNVLICMQYEQVFSERMQKIGFNNPKGKSRDLYFICWGNNSYRRLLDNKISQEKLKICGALQLDFLRTEFESFYLSRDEMAKRYGLDKTKKWVLYISSFTYVDAQMVKRIVRTYMDEEFVREFSDTSVKSQVLTLQWFEKLVQDNQEIIIIYRKHPVETGNERLQKLTEKFPEQFRDIAELSIKQWIKAADVITTWFSTSAAEVWAVKKPLLLIRPYPIKREYDAPFYYNSGSIDSYEKLFAAINDIEHHKQSVPTETIEEYYSVQPKPAYIRIADEIENIASYTQVNKEKFFMIRRIFYLLKNNILLKNLPKKVYQYLYFNWGIIIKNEKIRNTYALEEKENRIKILRGPLSAKKLDMLRKLVRGEQG